MNDVTVYQSASIPVDRAPMRVGIDSGAQSKRITDPRVQAATLLARLDRMLPAYMERLQGRAQDVLTGKLDVLEAERDQTQDDARMIAHRRLAERLNKGGPIG